MIAKGTCLTQPSGLYKHAHGQACTCMYTHMDHTFACLSAQAHKGFCTVSHGSDLDYQGSLCLSLDSVGFYSVTSVTRLEDNSEDHLLYPKTSILIQNILL